jgi:hypothetical protein
MRLTGYFLIFFAIILGLLTRIFAVFQYITFDIGPDPDQIRDAFAVMDMWRGNFPTLGPKVTTIGNHHILPLYYYIFFPFTLLGSNPVFQALPNAVFSFLSIPLFIYLVYQLLENVKPPVRVFLSGLAGFWYSLLFGEIFISNFQWNPSSIPFFLLVFTLLYQLQMERKFSLVAQSMLWVGYGVVLAILISLHTSTMLIMPLVFIFSSLIFIFRAIRTRQKVLIILPFISALSTIAALLPYWIGEVDRRFGNTKEIFRTIINASSKSTNTNFLVGLWGKLWNLFFNYFKLGEQEYFWNSSYLFSILSIAFLGVVTYLGVTKFKGNRYIWYIWCSTWLIYLLSASNLDSSKAVFYYKILILFAPIVLTMTSLAYLNYSKARNRILASAIGIVIAFSFLSNLAYDYQFMSAKYGQNKLLSTTETIQILNQLPANSTICDPRIKRKRSVNNQYHYLDTYITRRNVQVVETCQTGNYVIHPKRLLLIQGNFLNDKLYQNTYFAKFVPSGSPKSSNLWPVFKVEKNDEIARKSQLFLETETAYVYLLS